MGVSEILGRPQRFLKTFEVFHPKFGTDPSQIEKDESL
jgi:hypothetical protein